jgi:hypothetical protein
MMAANEITPRRETHIKRLPLVEEMSHFVESNLRRILKSYADYYNRTHRSLNKDTPVFRPGFGFYTQGRARVALAAFVNLSEAFAVSQSDCYSIAKRIQKIVFSFGRPAGLPETPFLNRECLGGLPRPDLFIARTSHHTMSGEIPAVIGIREGDLDRPACLLGNKFMISEKDGHRSAILVDPFAPKLLENGLQCRHPLGHAVYGDLDVRQQQLVDYLEKAGRPGR